MLLLGALLLRAGQPKEALEKLNEADTLQGNDPFCWLFLALAHDEVGKADLCREQLTKAARWLDDRRERYAAGWRSISGSRAARNDALRAPALPFAWPLGMPRACPGEAQVGRLRDES